MLWFLLVFTYLSSKENWFWSCEFSLFKVGLEEYWVGLGKNPSLHLGFSACYVMAALDNEWGGKPDSVLATRTLHFHLHLASYKPQFFWFSSSKKNQLHVHFPAVPVFAVQSLCSPLPFIHSPPIKSLWLRIIEHVASCLDAATFKALMVLHSFDFCSYCFLFPLLVSKAQKW